MSRKDFINDYDKMYDFNKLTKDEFLKSYSYLTDAEYEVTKKLVHQRKTILFSMNEIIREFSDDEELWLDWKTLGIPDGVEEFDDMIEFVDDESYEEMIHEFKVLIAAYKD